MGQVSKHMRRAENAYTHWCPGCEEMHRLPDGWTFNGDVNKPTFTPSFKHSGKKRNVDVKLIGAGRDAWLYDANGEPILHVCHYILTDGILNFCADSTHALAGKSVPLPELPEGFRDECECKVRDESELK